MWRSLQLRERERKRRNGGKSHDGGIPGHLKNHLQVFENKNKNKKSHQTATWWKGSCLSENVSSWFTFYHITVLPLSSPLSPSHKLQCSGYQGPLVTVLIFKNLFSRLVRKVWLECTEDTEPGGERNWREIQRPKDIRSHPETFELDKEMLFKKQVLGPER